MRWLCNNLPGTSKIGDHVPMSVCSTSIIFLISFILIDNIFFKKSSPFITNMIIGAMKALGVSSSSHQVIVPTYTCAACADAIVHAGGVPVPVDCELESFGLSYPAVTKAIEKNPNIVGVVLAPCYGVPSKDHVRIWEFCQAQGLWLCEDNCESYGAFMQINEGETPKGSNSISNHIISEDQHHIDYYPASVDNRLAAVGSLSTMSVVSVRSEKMVGVGEGGAIMSNDGIIFVYS